MLGLLIAAAAAMPSPASLPTVPRLIQTAQPVYCAGTHGRSFALTFDDGPSPYTLRLVRVLRKERARATFFLVGSRVGVWPAGARAASVFPIAVVASSGPSRCEPQRSCSFVAGSPCS